MRALVLSGGGSKGSFQVGAIKGLATKIYREQNDGIKQQPPNDWVLPWDFAYGVSTGALQACALAGGRFSDVLHLEEEWLKIKSYKDLFTKSFFWPLNLLFKDHLYGTKPLKKLINRVYNGRGLLRVCVGVVELRGKTFHLFTNDEGLTRDAFRKLIYASTAIPGIFPPEGDTKGSGPLYVDGGVMENAPLKAAIEQGADQIDVILTNPLSGGYSTGKIDRVYKVWTSALWSMQTEIFHNDLSVALNRNLAVLDGNCADENDIFLDINVLMPSRAWLNQQQTSTLDVDPKKIREGIAKGYETAFNGVSLESLKAYLGG